MSKSSNAPTINTTTILQDDGDKSDSANHTVNKDTVAKYLLEHPSFLIENPDLLLQLQVQIQDNGVVSLTQLQTEHSREKIKQLKSQLEQLIDNARRNELIYKTYAELNLDLARASSIEEIKTCIQYHLVESLGLETAQLMLMASSKEETKLSEIQHRSIFDKKLANTYFYFGRVGKVEKTALFPNANAESVALIKLSAQVNSHEAIGLLAIASDNPTHFQPGVNVDLVELLRKNLNFHLHRLSQKV